MLKNCKVSVKTKYCSVNIFQPPPQIRPFPKLFDIHYKNIKLRVELNGTQVQELE